MIDGLGQRLKLSRLQNNFTRKQVAEIIGVSTSLIGLYETNERLPSLPLLIKLASCYKVSTDYLLGCEAPEKKFLSTEGLTDQQIKALQLTISCFRAPHSKK